jgi:hypothetical protein
MTASEHFTFDTYSATVLETRNWSETHVSGGGGGSVPFGGVSVSSIQSTSRQRQVVWLRDDEELTMLKLPCRSGHRLTYLYGQAKRKPDSKYKRLIAVYNHTTNQWATINGNVIDLVNFSVKTNRLLLIMWPLAFFIGIQDTVGLIREDKIFIPFVVMLFVSLVSNYFRHRQPRLQLDARIAEEKAKIERCNPESLSEVDDVRLRPQMS